MTNTMNYNDKNFQQVAAAVMADMQASNVKCDTLDDMYNAACKYVQISKEQFMENLQQVKNQMKAMNESGKSGMELNEDDLDMVVGGSVGEWLSDHAKTIGIAIAVAAAITVAGAVLTAGCAAVLTTVAAAEGIKVGTVVGLAAAGGAVTGGIFGRALGIEAVITNKYKDGFTFGSDD